MSEILDDLQSPNFGQASEKFATFLISIETKLKESCCCPLVNSSSQLHSKFKSWQDVVQYHEDIKQSLEKKGIAYDYDVKRNLNDVEDKQRTEYKKLSSKCQELLLASLQAFCVVKIHNNCSIHYLSSCQKLRAKSPYKYVSQRKNLAYELLERKAVNNKNFNNIRQRPVSYPNNHSVPLEWDWRGTLDLRGVPKANGHQDTELESVDKQAENNLVYYAEEYEVWLSETTPCATRNKIHSRPPSLEPDELPTSTTAIIRKTDSDDSDVLPGNLLTITTPSKVISVVNNSNCPAQYYPHKYTNQPWRKMGYILIGFVILIISAIYREPPTLHKSYYYTSPPV